MDDKSKEIRHYGTKRHSGRYPWGSGDNAKQRNSDFLGYVDDLRSKGMTDTEIAKSMGISRQELHQQRSIIKAQQRGALRAEVIRLHDKGMSVSAIGRQIGKNESSVRALLDPVLKARTDISLNTADAIKNAILNKGPVDIGKGVEAGLGIARTKLNTAVRMLQNEGYNVFYVQEQQLGTGKYTSIKVLAPPGMTYKEVYENRANIALIQDHSYDGGRTFLGLKPIESVSGDRVSIRYSEDGGKDKDGVIELRRGVDDLDLGASRYAQVRIGVDGTHYLKGMAIYSDNLPDGVDIIYNTSKGKDTPRTDVFKEMKIDKTTGLVDADNPFGATIKRDGQRGALNIVNEEGDWSDWSRTISSQVLSKQTPVLAQKQLSLDRDRRKEEYNEIMSLTNPVLKKQLLNEYADNLDSAAVNLKAAALPRQASHVLLPLTNMNPKEVYAPMFKDGENVVLIRHPHGGIFEIPELIVNNRNPEAKKILGNAIDAIGIHPDVASKLSGADFDGDTAIVIPNTRGDIKTAPTLTALKNFDPRESYPAYDGMPKMSNRTKQLEMGKVSNLITDMTIRGATQDEIARAVKHSMVVIDAEKHNLNYKQSALDNDIVGLKSKYQGGPTAGAATLISRASSQQRVPERVEGKLITDPSTGKKKRVYVDPESGEKLYQPTGETYVNKDGKVVRRTTISTKMAEAKSAFDLSSGTRMEEVYASYADDLKKLANAARKEALSTPKLVRKPEVAKTYSKEVESLKAKLRASDMKRPLERQAQLAANAVYRAKLNANKNMTNAEKKRLRGQALTEARARLSPDKFIFTLSDKEWTAIQVGAVSDSMARRIFLAADKESIRRRATPRTAYVMTKAKVARAKTMAASGYTPAEIASALGVSATTVVNTLNE